MRESPGLRACKREAVSAAMRVRIETLPTPPRGRGMIAALNTKQKTTQRVVYVMSGISQSSRLQARIRYGSVEHARRNPAFAPRPADSIIASFDQS